MKKLSVVMLTYNRTELLARHLRFLEKLGTPHPIIVLDGSNLQNQEFNKKLIADIKTLKIEHYTYPEDLNVSMRMKDGISKVNTPYTALMADDDLLIPDSLDRCVEFLEANPDYVSCCGRVPCLFVRKSGSLSFFAIMDFLSANYSFSFESPLKRIIANDALTPMGQPPIFYSLKRTEILKEAFSSATPTMQFSAFERIMNSYVLLKGKHKVLDVPFAFRDYSSEAILTEFRDGLMNDKKYISGESEIVIQKFFKNLGVTDELMEAIYPKDGNITGDPDNIKLLEKIQPYFFIAKKIQYALNAITGAYLKKRFQLSDGHISALKSVI